MLRARQVPAEGPDVPTSRTSRRPRAAHPRGSGAAPAPTTCAVHAQPGLPARPPAGRARLKTDSSACPRRGGTAGCGSDRLLGRRAERGGRPRRARRSGETPLPAPGVGRCPARPPVPRPGREAGNARQARPRPCTRGRSSRPGRGAAGGSGQPSVGTGSVPWQRWRGPEPCAGRDVGASAVGAWRGRPGPRRSLGAGRGRAVTVRTENHFPRELSARSVQGSSSHTDGQRVAVGRARGPGALGFLTTRRVPQALRCHPVHFRLCVQPRAASETSGCFCQLPHRCPVAIGPAHTPAAL